MKKFWKKIKKNQGMTYVELIVVLSIFSIMSAIVIFNYGQFQAKVDIKNLAADIARKIVEAQKSALSGKGNANATSGWKPSYGLYANRTSDDKSFIYFADLDQSGNYTDTGCGGGSECLERISIAKGNYISALGVSGAGCPATVNNLSVAFTRPNSGATISSNPALLCAPSSVQITVASPNSSSTALIKVFSSGRIQIN